ncbi:tyrosine-type recombinase/integrase [Leadbettera azotonutricia]|uniref:Site-specific recombinase, phage integrase family n=1 Tax=Leadbettera azotonutricia (strain ATCC BAA-888 / DSM 13862 / ZAS-9) TaxID=545695 RepID=F5YCZ7_LEAAZ|nr:tyrosine-type recombinase/integrase [Leadbettera azotonutricia]AEF80867.1 site-specific recombinase, phage integrase family [Leadbettera azotonutricia ZAS-9]
MNNYPFSIFKRANRPCYSVAFKDETGKFMPPVSTKKATEAEAFKVAFQWLQEGIPQKQEKVQVKQLSLKSLVHGISTEREAETILKELKRMGFLKGYILTGTDKARDLIEFLTEFWDWKRSPYVQEKLRKKHSLHETHCRQMARAVERCWKPYFSGRLLGEITRQDLNAFIDSIGSQETSAPWKNMVIRAGTIALKWAFNREMIEKDVSAGIIWFSGKTKERQILSPEQAAAVFRASWKDERTRLGNLLAAVTGLRSGEIKALRVQDMGQDCLYIRHSFNRLEGLKETKNNEPRRVELPFPGIIRDMMNLAAQNPHGCNMDSFIFWAALKADKPLEERLLLDDLRDALVQTGMSMETAKVYTFHAWRHFFTAYKRPRIDEKLLQKQTGHKSLVMLDHYSDHVLDGDRQKMQQAQVEAFGDILPLEARAV